jgi:cell division protein FtsZ
MSPAQFPENKSKGIVAVGIGTAGCNILSQLADYELNIGSFNFLSCDKTDLAKVRNGEKTLIPLEVGGKVATGYVRGAALKFLDKIERMVESADMVIITAGLGGKVGSAISLLVAEACKKYSKKCMVIVTMPFRFENNKHFTAGVALKRLRKLAAGMIVVDNDEILDNAPQAPLLETYRTINDKIAVALSRLLGSSEERGISVDMHKLLETMDSGGYSLLEVVTSSINGPEEAVKKALKSICKSANPESATKALLYLIGDEKLSSSDLYASMNLISGVIGKGSLEIQYGFSSKQTTTTTAILLTSGYQSTRFDDYDPLSKILADSEIDDAPETSLGLDLGNIASVD